MPKTTYSYSYDVTECPECGHKLTDDYGVTIHFVVAGQQREVISRLTTEGNLVDVDDLVANGYHAGTSCGECGESLADFEECEESDA